VPPRTRSKAQPKPVSQATRRASADNQSSALGAAARGRSAAESAPAPDTASGPAVQMAGLRLPLPEALVNGSTGKRLIWLGGLGAMATIGLLEWPVAVAVGAGSFVAERFARANSINRHGTDAATTNRTAPSDQD
jgi:hypothetical protein